ncbi:hypothetical protein J4E83_004689 [Alternaria metachromatica]|uniref:uncharacterized protein n=1 Tax=Alternaria metachromatica TaxID=283354 RepID=UPI0020C3CD34|nr:uncharacterized protein J4E83_004689 [Alternaria metachromatica]KAI4623296.1 hypothetical protein J4E83_004689 [Alternaria metachromatica]
MTPALRDSLSSPLTISTTHTAATFPVTPPVHPDLSRPRLKQIARWIRDELDLRVARDGPDVLRPDDVLTLHETLVALRQAQNITISVLRATGIHKAVQDVAGVATRWPSRLCDDCDKIVDSWTAKFGPFSEIHPFLYGRGGRLEGIASVNEYSREALLKRWAETCPEKIHPKRSHKLGDLGFVAGTWWINPLFAHHAGIIGLEACDGGTTYDKHGAYALLLKDTGEIEASSEERFTYRVPQNDKGKFRLTSATPKSRDPVRVLRSHSINSVWGPKAGVRYEGLYSVRGWSIKQAKSSNLAGGQWKEGDILFDVLFERTDSVPMAVVTKRPTATEVDDYAEYKRLRKVNRDGKRKSHSTLPVGANKGDFSTPLKTAPPVTPHVVPKPLPTEAPPNEPRRGIFKHLHFDEEAHVHVLDKEDVISPKSVPEADPLTTTATMSKSNTLLVPAKPNRTNTHSKADVSTTGGEPRRHASPAGSNASSAHTHASATTFPGINIREVAPWIDYDADLSLPSPPEDSTIVHQRPIITQSIATDSIKTSISRDTFGTPVEGDMSSPVGGGNGNGNGSIDGGRHGRRGDVEFGDSLSPHGHGHGHGLGLGVGKKDGGKRKSILVRNRNPVGRLFDGVVEDDEMDGKPGKWNTPTLTTPMFHDFADVTSLEDPFIANPPPRISRRPRRPYAPTSSRNLISRSRVLTPVGSPVCILHPRRVGEVQKEPAESKSEMELRAIMKRVDGGEMARWRYI